MQSVIILLAVLVSLSGAQWLESPGASTLEYQTTLWSMELPLPNDTFWRSSVCANTNLQCANPFSRCCDDCSVPASQRLPSGCVCPDSPASVCLDGSRSQFLGDVFPSQPIQIAIPILNPTCASVRISLDSLSGDANLKLTSADPALAVLTSADRAASRVTEYRTRTLDSFGDDSLFICVSPGSPVTAYDPNEVINGNSIHAINVSAPFSWIYATIYSQLPSIFRLSLFVMKDLLVPVSEISSRIPASISCSDANQTTIFRCGLNGASGPNCEAILQNLYAEVPFTFHAQAAGLLNESELGASRGLSLILPVRLKSSNGATIRVVQTESNITSCFVNLLGLVNSSGDSLSTNLTQFRFDFRQTVDNSSFCNDDAMSTLQNQIQSQLESYSESIGRFGNELGVFGFLYGAFLANPAQQGCRALLSTAVKLEPSKKSQFVEVASTTCSEDTDSTMWSMDPCCNETLALTQCCAPRVISVASLVPVATSESLASCQTQKCVSLVAENFANLNQQRAVQSQSCAEQLSLNTNDPAVFANITNDCSEILSSYERSAAPCRNDSDCFTQCDQTRSVCIPPIDPADRVRAYQDCLLSSMAAPIRAVLLAGRNASEFMSQFVEVACDQGNRLSPDSTLSDQLSCETAFGCNADQNLNEEQCLRLAALFPQMCARCDGAQCSEVSRFRSCYLFPAVSTADECTSGGPQWVWNNGRCLRSDVLPDFSNCLVAGGFYLCDKSFTGDANLCPPLCQPDTVYFGDSQRCSCANQINSIRTYAIWKNFYCKSFEWAPVLQTRMCVSHLSAADCLAANQFPQMGFLFFLGRGLDPDGFLDSEAECTGNLQNYLACSQTCADCASQDCGSCSMPNGRGVCWYPFQSKLTAEGVKLTCPNVFWHKPVEDGCLDIWVNQSECFRTGGMWRWPTSPNSTACSDQTACFSPGQFEYVDGSVVSFSNLNDSSCINCQRSPISLYKWRQAGLIDRRDLQWINRTWTTGVFHWRQVFNRIRFDSEYAAARSRFLELSYRTALSCLVDQDLAALTKISCDCGGGGSQCFQETLSFTALSTTMCGRFRNFIVVPAVLRVETFLDTGFRLGCTGVVVDVFDSGNFARSSKSVSSSAFAQSIELKSLSVVKNSNGAVIGQLTSDGYRVVFDSDENPVPLVSGGFQICLPIISVSKQPGFRRLGVARARLHANVKSSTFKIFSIDPPIQLDSLYCFNISTSGIYALAWMSSSAKDASYFDNLRADQQAALIIIIIVYVALFSLISVCFLNFVLWWTVQKTITKFSVDTLKAAINFSLLWVASILRWVFFLVTIVGAGSTMPEPVEIFLVELPLFFFFSVLTVIILKWLEVARKSGGKGKKPPLFSISNIGALILNWIMYSLLVIFVILASTGVAEEKSNKCSTSPAKENPALSITYHVIVAVICFSLGASFIVIGTKVTIQLLQLGGATSQKVRFTQFTAVAGACSIAMILQAILLVVTTAVVVPSIVAIIILIIVEVIPIILLIWTWNKPIAIGKVMSSIVSIGSSRSETTSSGSSTSGVSSSATSSSSAGASAGSGSESDSTASSSGGLARLWSLGTDSLGEMSVSEDE